MRRWIALPALVLGVALATVPARAGQATSTGEPRTAPGDELPDGEGKKILVAACTSCHDLGEVTKFRGYWDREQWRAAVVTMAEYGAPVEAPQIDVLADYLYEHLGRPPESAALDVVQVPSDPELPRRPLFGVALAPHESGAVVTDIVPGSTAAAGGVRVGDVIRAVDGVVAESPNDVIAAVARHAVGETAIIDIIRDEVTQPHSVVLRPLPRETMAGVTFEYGAVATPDGSRLRTILSVPESRDGRSPAVLLLQGGGCGSVDTPMAADVGQPGLVRTIAAGNFVTMRVEKSGVGDSQGPPCSDIGYTQELDGYRAALSALTRHPSVDPDRVYLLGISLGGVFAPIVASETPVRGVVVYGTLATPPGGYAGRSDRFFREFASVDVARAWSAVDARVLVLRGELDETARAADHDRIAAIVNASHPGAATYRELAGLDHGWTRHESLEQSRGNAGRGEQVTTLPDAILEFLRTDS